MKKIIAVGGAQDEGNKFWDLFWDIASNKVGPAIEPFANFIFIGIFLCIYCWVVKVLGLFPENGK